MSKSYGTREILRNPSLLRIEPNESIIIEDKKSHKKLGVYLGTELAEEFFAYRKKYQLLKSAQKIKDSANHQSQELEGTLADGL